MTDQEKACVFLKYVEEYGDWGEHWIDFSAVTQGCDLGEAFEAAVRVLKETLRAKAG